MPFLVKRLSLRGWPAGNPLDDEACVRFVQLHGIRVMTEAFPLERAQEAFDARASVRFRAVLVPHGSESGGRRRMGVSSKL